MAEPVSAPCPSSGAGSQTGHWDKLAVRGQFCLLCCRPCPNYETGWFDWLERHIAPRRSRPSTSLYKPGPQLSSPCANPFLASSLALFHLVEGYSYRRLPRQPRRFTISAPHPVPSHYCDSLQPTSSSSNSSEQSLAPSTPIQPGATRSNVRSVTLLHTACTGSRDGFLAFLHFSFTLQLLSLPVLSFFVSRALFRVARASIETVQCSTQTSLTMSKLFIG